MGFRDFAANRSFSGNGLWQWDEKSGLARHAGDCLIQLVRVLSWGASNCRATTPSVPTIFPRAYA